LINAIKIGAFLISAEIKTPRGTPYTVQNAVFYYLAGNYTVGTLQGFGTFQILEMNLYRDVVVILYSKPEADKVAGLPCDDNIRDIPQERIMNIYNNHTAKGMFVHWCISNFNFNLINFNLINFNLINFNLI
jgi:hypothetical protein